MSQDIVDFLRARYAETRRREMAKISIRMDGVPRNEIVSGDGEGAYVLLGEGNSPHRPRVSLADFNERWGESAADPFVLADLDAKEQILRELPGLEWHEPCASLAWLVLALLAQPYVAHPDYREEWRP
ncbi:DUF6221 family protein [Streptomyces sp. NBC_00433]